MRSPQSDRHSPSLRLAVVLLALGATASSPAPAQSFGEGPVELNYRRTDKELFDASLSWPEPQRLFMQDGPRFLLARERAGELAALSEAGRQAWIDDFLGRDPEPSTPENELVVGIEKRRRMVLDEFESFQDVRARLLFLHGEPLERRIVDCTETFKPMELWYYPEPGAKVPTADDGVRVLVLYRPKPETPFQMWLPLEGKVPLYIDEMAYYLEQWEELKNQIVAPRRIDRFFCEDARDVDRIVGIDGLYRFEKDRPDSSVFQPWLRGPDDLRSWALRAAAEDVEFESGLENLELQVFYPERVSQRMVTRLEVRFDEGDQLENFDDGESLEKRVVFDGYLERAGAKFEDFRVRFQLDAKRQDLSGPLALVAERKLRPDERFLLRLRVIDEVSGKETLLSRGLVVPAQATPLEQTVDTEQVIEALGEELMQQRVEGYDSLVIVPPVQDVIFGLWRAEALVTGARITEVRFLVDGQVQLIRKSMPFTAELRLQTYPTEQLIRVEGYDDDDELVAADEVIINQPRGELSVEIEEPVRGSMLSGEVKARAEIVVPEEKRVVKVEFSVNDEVQLVLEAPPWEGTIRVPETSGAELAYLTVTAELNDGLRAEDVRFLNAPDFVEEVDVDLVELYTTVTGRDGRLVQGLTRDQFRVAEDGRPQQIVKFELVEDLPISVGIAIDVSGSMFESLPVAQRTAVDFLNRIITPRDRAFAVAFSDRPELLMTRTSDVGAIEARLENLVADGLTSLHDAVVTSLYYYRGVSGRRALVLLSDGEDTSSTVPFDAALEYARRSGVAIYSVGLDIGRLSGAVRGKLRKLAEETGGRSFFIRQAEDLHSVYDEIERELRSQYLIAYESDKAGDRDVYREVEVEVLRSGLEARTIKGYYP